jgi:hypothetical protein
MPSPQVTVSDNGGAPVDPVASGTGVNVVAGDTIVIQLQNLAADNWSCNLVGQDDQVVPPTFTLDPVAKNVTFTAPGAPFALLFESVVDEGDDINGNPVATYRQRFAIYSLATGGFRVLASNERNEGNALFGWIVTINEFIRLLAGGATGGANIVALNDANVTGLASVGNIRIPILALTATRTVTLPAAPTPGTTVTIADVRKLITLANNIIVNGGSKHIYVGGVDEGTSLTMGTPYSGDELRLIYDGTAWS